MSTPPEITFGGAERYQQAAEITAKNYSDAAVINYLLQSVPSSTRAAYLPKYIGALVKAASLNKALFIEAGDWKHVSIIITPGEKVDNPMTLWQAGLPSVLWNIGLVGCWRTLFEYEPLALAALKKALKNYHNNHYYVYFTSTLPEARHAGYCASVVRDLQQKAESEKVPIWLEAINPQTRDYFAKLGFELCDEIVLGKGKADVNGNLKAGGEGVMIWGMVWWPVCLRDAAVTK